MPRAAYSPPGHPHPQGRSPPRRRLEWAADGQSPRRSVEGEEGDFYAGDPFIDEPFGMSPLTERDLSMPKVPISQRIYDVAVPGRRTATGDVSITYRKGDANGKWINFKRKAGS
ncbi:transcriptional regulator family: Fungal Specific TF [Penicillium alfredii]|uniref:Transcriptional regulator family: Fungal Specific TF n=1 Tax=Penicillium alfredii TaxID=1506179 RepID=A0A9W9FA26_9EURO|nr:transcriptional regulator family: Fungal Specific TF [Penicillium alfredii]KAJ5096199.1 transcriptional regulator family: Fungal Specific TF [Penicillium alfredii]